MNPVRILIADDHEIVRSGVRTLLEREPGWVVCGQAGTGRDAVAMALDLKPDVVILDVSMRDLNGIQVAREIRRVLQTPIVFMTAYDSADIELDAIEAGATGFLSKFDAARSLIDAVRAVLSRKYFFSSQVDDIRVPGRGDDGEPEPRHLTPREREVLRLLAEGNTNKQVATRLGISAKTAETHRARIISKLELHGVSSLVRYAIRHRIIEP